MKHIFMRAVSAAIGTALAAGTFAAIPAGNCAASEEAAAMSRIIFDYEGEGITIAEDKDGNIPELNDLTGDAGYSAFIPNVKLSREGYSFSGWTYDGVRGYVPGEVIQFGQEDIKLKPVWAEKDAEVKYSIVYYAEFDGEVLGDDIRPADTEAAPGQIVKVSGLSINRDGYSHIGWIFEDQVFEPTQHFVMPEQDIQLTPNWLKKYHLTFSPGDVDRIVGAVEIVFDRTETISTNLADYNRFSRDGFEITGWLCDYDGEVYEPLIAYDMPSCDVTMTAVWKPINYGILFDEGSSSFKQRCTTDDYLVIPDCRSVRSGYTFVGWEYDGELFYPGDEYLVKGVCSGLGYAFSAVWTKDEDFPELAGDANGDGMMNLADAVRIMQSVGNPDKYSLCEQAAANADVDANPGVTNLDALHIQRYLMGIITEF